MTIERPAIFIGSSVEGLDVAYALQENLEYDGEPTVWPQGIFAPSQSTLQALASEARKTDFAIFAFTPDDVRTMRGAEAAVPRDNVIFELGLFVGSLGIERCSFVTPRLSEPLALPTDLLGITPLNYDAARSDGRLVAALGPAANKVRGALRHLGPKPVAYYRTTDAAPSAAGTPDRTDYFIVRWNDPELTRARDTLRAGIPFHAIEDEDGRATAALQSVFVFLESFADSLLSGEIDEKRARPIFETPVKSIWDRASTYLAPLNLAAEWWDPPPRLSTLAQRWSQQ